MDTGKVGAFLKVLRKEQNLTQEQLGAKIGVTNKTVSRWETGNYMPPVESLEQLSRMYGVTINEILAGERVSEERFTEVADENLTRALEELEEEERRFERRMIALLAATTVLAMAIILMLPLHTAKDFVVLGMVICLGYLANIVNLIAVAQRKGRKGNT